MIGFSELKIKSQFLLQNNVQQAQIISETANTTTNTTNNEPYVEIPLTLERAETIIKQYAETKGNAGNRQLYATLIASKIILTETTICITITNDVQLQLLNNMRQDMLDELRQLLSNKQAQLTIVVSETSNESKAYKPDDKFKMLAEKNPFLMELKKRFDLSVEY